MKTKKTIKCNTIQKTKKMNNSDSNKSLVTGNQKDEQQWLQQKSGYRKPKRWTTVTPTKVWLQETKKMNNSDSNKSLVTGNQKDEQQWLQQKSGYRKPKRWTTVTPTKVWLQETKKMNNSDSNKSLVTGNQYEQQWLQQKSGYRKPVFLSGWPVWMLIFKTFQIKIYLIHY